MARTAIITSGDNLTMNVYITDQVKSLPQEQLNSSCNQNSALLSWQHGKPHQHKGPNNQSSDNPHRNLKCNYCHKVGHIKVDCRKKKRADEKQESAKMAAAEVQLPEEFHGLAFMTTSTDQQPEEVFAASTHLQQAGVEEDEWIGDSGCTNKTHCQSLEMDEEPSASSQPSHLFIW